MVRFLPLILALVACAPPLEEGSGPPGDPEVVTVTQTWESQVFTCEACSADVLLVVDTSENILPWFDDLEQLAIPLQEAVDTWPLDYHIGLITMDMFDPNRSGRLVGDGVTRWSTLATGPVGTSLGLRIADLDYGSNLAAGTAAVQRALVELDAPGEYNEGFRREFADLHLVFVSASPDFSAGSQLTSVEDDVGPGHRLIVSGLIDPGVSPYRGLDPDDDGSWVDLRDPWDDLFDALEPDDPVAQGELHLDGAPDPATLVVEVAVDGVWEAMAQGEWSWDPTTSAVRITDPLQRPLNTHYRVSWFPEDS